MTPYLKEIIVAYFQGRNATGKAYPAIKADLEAIREFYQQTMKSSS
ncbi:MAG: hypothetical protein WC619_03920 [Patescibacteria group bacterium]